MVGIGKKGITVEIKKGKKPALRFDGRKIEVTVEKIEDEEIRKAIGKAFSFARQQEIKEITFERPKAMAEERFAWLVGETITLASYEFNMKTKKEKTQMPKVFVNIAKKWKKVLEEAITIAEGQNYTRHLANLPANIATPEFFAKEAKKLAKELGLKVKIFKKRDLERMGMGGILAVSAGSEKPPVLVVLEYSPPKVKKHIALVGKGVTFDAGGLDLKPADYMEDMKLDKTGACVVLGVIRNVAKLKLPIKVSAYLPFVENLPSGKATKPGDIIKMYNGKTVEILNTDAEGRLILADALAYASEKRPDAIVDVATLTGAIIIALGRYAIGMYSTDEKLKEAFVKAGEKTYERVWPMPLFKEYGEMMKSDFADLKNISGKREAGSITAAAFLKEFVNVKSWVHLDIAGVMEIKESHPYFSKGAPGIGVRLITEVISSLARE